MVRRSGTYYTTLGLLDRPAEMRGRTAYYGPRHLLQLLAIKRLQAAGRTLTEIQQTLLGLSEGELRRLAGQQEEPTTRRQRTKTTRESEAFWRTPPAPVAANEASEATVLQAVRLGLGLVLTIEARRTLSEDDLTALGQAAGPLLEL